MQAFGARDVIEMLAAQRGGRGRSRRHAGRAHARGTAAASIARRRVFNSEWGEGAAGGLPEVVMREAPQWHRQAQDLPIRRHSDAE